MNNREKATILAALRCWRENMDPEDALAPEFESTGLEPLSSDEIQSLIENLTQEDSKFSDFGIEISGGYIAYPDDEGTIRRVDDDGNTLEVRRCEDEGYSEWAELFNNSNSKE